MIKKSALIAALSITPFFSNSAIITHGSLSLDTQTNIVTDYSQGLEWLQWDETVNMYLAEARDEYHSTGWRVALYGEVESLLSGHFGKSLGEVYQDGGHSWAYAEGEALYSSFSELFGVTGTSCFESRISLDCVGDSNTWSSAWFYKKAPSTSLVPWTVTARSAYLLDKITDSNPPREFGQSIALNDEFSQYYTRSTQGTALVRAISERNQVSVSEPSAIFLLLGALPLIFRRIKK
ncbi:hypothetical protein BM524_15175 [Alteromonas mediterranea]|uniref:PEP-CTERM protein-sorting domain-containing protein n=1 Tax=Alteromonas mediterranea TaxID=314275 RepID=A0AAC9JCA7_9ALTE|nr:hypothetical protein [Alteromonas mediterranea]APD91030.1 hypothetical protein BM524_15175 [Alteromonas mediterranea]